MSGDVYLTRDGYEKLSHELQELKTVKRRQISQAIEHARQLGDISENAEYDSAKDAQALNEHRIVELEDKLSRARVVEQDEVGVHEVRLGVKVKLLDLDFKDELEYTMVGEAEADFEQNKISLASPVGKALLGHKPGDEVAVAAPARTIRYKIISLSR